MSVSGVPSKEVHVIGELVIVNDHTAGTLRSFRYACEEEAIVAARALRELEA